MTITADLATTRKLLADAEGMRGEALFALSTIEQDRNKLRESFETFREKVMEYINEAFLRLNADTPKDTTAHPVSRYLMGLALEAGKADGAISKSYRQDKERTENRTIAASQSPGEVGKKSTLCADHHWINDITPCPQCNPKTGKVEEGKL